jgi:predicted metal-binding membrane protein
MSLVAAAAELQASARMMTEHVSQRVFWGVLALLFVACATATVVSCARMAAMAEMPMPGGWTMSMAWLRAPGQTWFGATASFTGMWVVMTVAMMLPALAPTLWRFRNAIVVAGETPPGVLAASTGAASFCVWTAFGIVAFGFGAGLATIAMQSTPFARAVPVAAGVVVLLAGALQFSAWKARRLACCRDVPAHGLPAGAADAWRYGLRLGLDCSGCCGGLMTILLVAGVMDVRAMVVVTAAVTVERLARQGKRAARTTGVLAVAAGAVLIARGFGLG